MRILITGGSGFIGTNLIAQHVKDGHDVLNLDISAPRCAEQVGLWKHVDLLEADALARAIVEFSPEIVLHMGARTDLGGKSVGDYLANTQGVENIISALHSLPNLKRVIYASSRMVCRIGYQPRNDADYCPSTAYGESKVIGEKIVRESRQHACPWVIVRPTSIWGPWFDAPYKGFFTAIARGLYLHPAGHEIHKSFGFVLNSVYQLKRLIEAPEGDVAGRTFYIADYPPIEVGQFAQAIRAEMNAPKIREVSAWILRALAISGDLLQRLGWNNPPLTTFRLDNLLTEMIYDLSDTSEVVGSLPYTMLDGVRITTQWMRNEHA